MKRVPRVTVRLGTVLDLVTERGHTRTFWESDVRGWHLLTVSGAEHMGPGRARVFLVAGDIEGWSDEDTERAERTYARWHRRDDGELVGELEIPDEFEDEPIGRAVQLDYASDKYGPRGKVQEYTHDFFEDGGRPPLIYANDRSHPRAFVLVGGSMRVSERGIE